MSWPLLIVSHTFVRAGDELRKMGDIGKKKNAKRRERKTERAREREREHKEGRGITRGACQENNRNWIVAP